MYVYFLQWIGPHHKLNPSRFFLKNSQHWRSIKYFPRVLPIPSPGKFGSVRGASEDLLGWLITNGSPPPVLNKVCLSTCVYLKGFWQSICSAYPLVTYVRTDAIFSKELVFLLFIIKTSKIIFIWIFFPLIHCSYLPQSPSVSFVFVLIIINWTQWVNIRFHQTVSHFHCHLCLLFISVVKSGLDLFG